MTEIENILKGGMRWDNTRETHLLCAHVLRLSVHQSTILLMDYISQVRNLEMM